MDVAQREVPPDVADVAELPQQLAHHRLGPPAVRALEVAVLDNRDGSVDRAAEAVALRVDVDVEIDQRLRCSQQRADAQAAGQPRGRAEEQPREQPRTESGAEDADLRLLEPPPVEG